MKFSASLLFLASSALAQLQQRGGGHHGGDHGGTTTLTTYTTVTTCPVTSTYTKEGTTYCVTALTTSTIVVTDCKGCGVTTVQGPDVTKTDYDVEYTTYTTVCPVTETKTVGGEEVTVTYTTTSVVTEAVKTTEYDYVTQPDTTKTELDVEYTTYTTVCPVTETKTVEGEEVTVVYTTTSVVTEAVKTTEYDYYTKPGETKTEVDVEYSTYTTVCPVTETKYVEGKPTTLVYTTTSVVTEAIKSTAYDYQTKPGETKVETDVEYSTYTTVCPVTETKYVEGKPTTLVYTTTSVVTEAIKSTAYDYQTKPGETKLQTDVEYSTYTTVCPVTETKYVEGKPTTLVYTTTSVVKEAVKTTVYEVVTKPGETKTAVDVAYVTQTSLCPVTETKTVNGEVITKVYTSTEYIVSKVKTTIDEYKTVYETATGVEVYTKYTKVLYTVGGGTVVETIVPGTTVNIPETEIVTVPQVTFTSEPATTPTSAPAELPGNSGAANQPAFALMAGIVGALALL